MSSDEANGKAAAPAADDDRGHFIPIRKTDVLDAMIEHGQLASEAEREQFRQVCRLLAAIYHYEYFDRLEKLRDAYFYFSPELDLQTRFDRATINRAYDDLMASFADVLKGANFVEMTRDEIAASHGQREGARIAVEAPVQDFREVKFFRRGHHKETFDIPYWFGLRKREVQCTVHDDIVLLVAMKLDSEITSRRERNRLKQLRIRPGSVLIKYFRNIVAWDINALYPNARVVMTMFDKLFLGLPALAGAIPILFNLASTVTVLFLVIGFYLGISGAIEDNQMKTAFAAMSGLVALGGFVMRQWVKYQRTSLRYQKDLADNIYFRNINNNAGIFDYIIGAAEEQECKEAFLAYYFLRTMPSAPTQAELDERIEQWILQTFKVDVDFEVDDALAKLERLELLRREGERLSVPAPEEALARLDYIWDNYFKYNVDETETKATVAAK
jgi:hypothetical protein